MDSSGWSAENPFWGHCAVVSLVAQDLFGGDLLRASLEKVPGFENMRSHYWNKLADGSIIDLTASQFGTRYPHGLNHESKQRSYVLSYPETAKRYKLLALRLAKILNNNNPLFDDPIYQKCLFNALNSSCQKLKFGCVITKDQTVISETHNQTLEPLKSFCEPTCIRLSMQSRSDAMIGACGHAEELGIWQVVRAGVQTNECELYVAGIDTRTYSVLIKKESGFTCLRCGNQIYQSQLKQVYTPVVDRWVGINAQEALKSALAFQAKLLGLNR
ncbi:MAG: hypothetical protein HYT65_00825 [Candidatus Yanofskybacteria bacterium]|nr:hypothetical protein [Candidatus Yanofskybacteria bacterium]